MRAIVTLFVFLIVGYLGSRRFVSRAMRRYPWNGLLVTGVEFLVLGIVLGPRTIGLISREVMADLEPVVYLTLGSIGLLIGIEATWGQVRKTSSGIVRVLLWEAASFFVVITPAAFLVFTRLFPGAPATQRFLFAAVMSVTASVSSPTLIALLSRILPSRGPFTNTVKIIAALNPFLPLLAFGLLITVLHPRFFGFEVLGAGVLWWLFLNFVALTLGFFMVLFTRERCTDDEMLLLIVGTVLVVGGLCYFLQLSSLYTGMVMGFVVGHLSRKRDQIFRELHRIEKILFVAFLILVGASLDIDTWWVLVVAGGYVATRLLLKLGATGGALNAWFPHQYPRGRRSGLVFAALGGVALAIALDCSLASESELARFALAVVAVAVVVNDIVAVAVTRRVLAGAREVVDPTRRREGNRDGA
jgi:Kef-type K+ transport system membrane component KefB